MTNVFFRDVSQAVGVALQFWFWLTPIVYPLDAVPSGVRSFIAWNPLFPLVRAYQGIIVDHRWPAWSELWPVCALTLVVAGLRNVNTISRQRELDFRKLAYLSQSTAFIGVAVTIALAWWLRNVWSLVIGAVVTVTLDTLLSVDPVAWRHEVESIGKYLDEFRERVPPKLREELKEVAKRLGS